MTAAKKTKQKKTFQSFKLRPKPKGIWLKKNAPRPDLRMYLQGLVRKDEIEEGLLWSTKDRRKRMCDVKAKDKLANLNL